MVSRGTSAVAAEVVHVDVAVTYVVVGSVVVTVIVFIEVAVIDVLFPLLV